VGGTGGGDGGISGTGGAAGGGTGGNGVAGGAAGTGSGGAAGTGGGGAACAGHDIDVPVATVTGTVTVNGAPFSSTTEPRRLSFRNAAGDTATLVATDAGTYTARLVPGTYDVYYLSDAPSSTLPLNYLARIRTGVVIPTGTSSLDIDIPVATITGSITVDGVALPSSSDFARIYLRDASGIALILGHVGQGTYTARLVPGTYDVEYSLEASSSTLPLNLRTRIRTGVVIPSGTSSLNIDVPVATVTGSLTVGGVAVSATSNALISVRNATAGGVADLGYIRQGTYTARLVPGTYYVHYLGETGSSGVPINEHARIRTVVIPSGSSSLDIDVPIATVTGSFTVDGAAVPSASQYGFISLRNLATDDVALIGNTGQSTYTTRLVPGTYDVFYGLVTASSTLPVNYGRIRTGVVIPTGTSSLNIDVPVATVTGSFTVNGVANPSMSNDGRIGVRNLTDDRINAFTHLGYTGQTTYTARLTPGTYDVYYDLPTTGSILPINNGKIRVGVVIPTGASSLDIDIPVAPVTGSLTVDGAAVPSTTDYGRITLKNVTTGAFASLGDTTQSTYTARLIPGTYDLYYSRATGSGVPQNTNAKLRCFSVP
jgi:hypothetical protein